MERQRLSVAVSKKRWEKLKRVAKEREKSMSQLIQDWIDSLVEST